jgi:hypothetical protein
MNSRYLLRNSASAVNTGEIPMKLIYDVIEDVYDDTTQIRTMTEQAQMPSGDWLIRTTLYTSHHIRCGFPGFKGKKGKRMFQGRAIGMAVR